MDFSFVPLNFLKIYSCIIVVVGNLVTFTKVSTIVVEFSPPSFSFISLSPFLE
jgi:hypothetical protein